MTKESILTKQFQDGEDNSNAISYSNTSPSGERKTKPKMISKREELKIMEQGLKDAEAIRDEFCKANNVLPSQRDYIKKSMTVLDVLSELNSDIKILKRIIFKLRNEIGELKGY
jgi:hypothetical protein